MTEINGLSCFELAFNSLGQLDEQRQSGNDLETALAVGDIHDVLVFAHGWNTSPLSARSTRQAVFGLLAEQLGDRVASCAAVGIDWPSLLFPEDDPSTTSAAATSGAQLANALAPAFPQQQFQLDELGALLDHQPAGISELDRFHYLAKELVTSPSLALEDSGEAAALSVDTVSLFGHAAAMAKQPLSRPPVGTNHFQTLWAGGREVLRILCYYEMKNRAGVVGKDGLGPLLSWLRTPTGPPRIHLLGHSYGARLVAYALAGLSRDGRDHSPVKSLYLIQGALSHFAFTDPLPTHHQSRRGQLAADARLVEGPMLATFSQHDRCLGWWYPNAGLLSREENQSTGELAYHWGAMGHDGFQGSGTVTMPLGEVGHRHQFESGGQYALDSSTVIAANQSAFGGAHSDILHPEVIWPAVEAAGLSRPR
ncbi:MAG: alpha/beta hydrolase [Actinomycetota bacterium]|nr:alpha/beta hydrolase [Actinomycetota bacterium]MDQ2958837.1 alpha/beta hydrolase [Actinomycetota bacterium]